METVLAKKEVKRANVVKYENVTEVRSRITTIGGTVILAVMIVLSLVFVFSFLFPRGNGIQLVIIVALTAIGWGFFINCATEKLSIKDGVLEFRSVLSRTVTIELADIDSYKLTNFGLRLDGNMYLIEVEHEKSEQPAEIWLSPCWKKEDLSRFCGTLGVMLETINNA